MKTTLLRMVGQVPGLRGFSPAVAIVLCFGLHAQTSVDKRTFSGVHEVIVDNVNGPLEITADGGDAVEMEAIRETRASSAEDEARAQREVKLDVEQSGGKLRIYVDGPFRCNCRDGSGWRSRDYSVSYHFKLRVPAAASLDARTVNGEVTARYAKNPGEQVRLETINGSVDTSFVGGLGADVRAKTLNGGIYTDYEVSALPRRVTVDHVSNMTRYRQEGTPFRIGNGGPELNFKTINGNVFIRSK